MRRETLEHRTARHSSRWASRRERARGRRPDAAERRQAGLVTAGDVGGRSLGERIVRWNRKRDAKRAGGDRVDGAVAGFYATSTYNEGAVEVDYQSYSSPEEAVSDTLRKVNALQSAPSAEVEASGEASGEATEAVAASEPES